MRLGWTTPRGEPHEAHRDGPGRGAPVRRRLRRRRGGRRRRHHDDHAADHGADDDHPSVPAGDAVAVNVYFVRNEFVATAGRAATAPAVARGALTELLAGPDDFETGIGMTTAIPAGTELLGIDITDGEATVDLSGEFQSGGGSLSMQLRVAEVVFTLTQFPTVETVSFELDGEAVEFIGGEGIDATDVTRAEMSNVTPFILVESPVPGETVEDTFAVTGISNTFEANVQYRLVGPDDAVLDEGFTTATAGTGTWGDFAFDVTSAVPRDRDPRGLRGERRGRLGDQSLRGPAARSAEAVMSAPLPGLSRAEVAARLTADGPNRLPPPGAPARRGSAWWARWSTSSPSCCGWRGCWPSSPACPSWAWPSSSWSSSTGCSPSSRRSGPRRPPSACAT